MVPKNSETNQLVKDRQLQRAIRLALPYLPFCTTPEDHRSSAPVSSAMVMSTYGNFQRLKSTLMFSFGKTCQRPVSVLTTDVYVVIRSRRSKNLQCGIINRNCLL